MKSPALPSVEELKSALKKEKFKHEPSTAALALAQQYDEATLRGAAHLRAAFVRQQWRANQHGG